MRLVDGSVASEGRVEIFHDGQWGTVCDDDWDINDASVVCRQLGYLEATTAWQSAHFGQGSGEIFMDDVDCDGSDKRLGDCDFRGWGVHNCGHGEDASVTCEFTCTEEGDVRLFGGSVASEGRVAIFHDGQWGTVCDDSWDINDASVVCRQLGFLEATTAWQNAHFGQGSGKIFMDDVECDGDEERLGDCDFSGWCTENCGHSEDASVTCSPGMCFIVCFGLGDRRKIVPHTSFQKVPNVYT